MGVDYLHRADRYSFPNHAAELLHDWNNNYKTWFRYIVARI